MHYKNEKGQFIKGGKRPQWLIDKTAKKLKGRKLSEEHRKNIGKGNKGRKLSEETKRKISEAHKGLKHSKATRDKLSKSLLGRKLSKETCDKMSNTRKGKELPWRDKINESLPRGEKHHRWIKDRSKIQQHLRNNPVYQQWRKKVFKRDNWTCKLKDSNCEGKIKAHHIRGWAKYPNLRYEVDNGITLCEFHHPLKRQEEEDLIPVLERLI